MLIVEKGVVKFFLGKKRYEMKPLLDIYMFSPPRDADRMNANN